MAVKGFDESLGKLKGTSARVSNPDWYPDPGGCECRAVIQRRLAAIQGIPFWLAVARF